MIVLYILGMLFASLVTGVFLCCAFEGAVNSLNEYNDRKTRSYRELGRKQIGNDLMSEAYWFSENKQVYEAIKCIGQEINRTGYLNMQQARNRWREKL